MEVLGEGSFGKVFLGLNTRTGSLMAIKEVDNNPHSSCESSAHCESNACADKQKLAMVKALKHEKDSEIATLLKEKEGLVEEFKKEELKMNRTTVVATYPYWHLRL